LAILKSLSALRENSSGSMLDTETTTQRVATTNELNALKNSGLF